MLRTKKEAVGAFGEEVEVTVFTFLSVGCDLFALRNFVKSQ